MLVDQVYISKYLFNLKIIPSTPKSRKYAVIQRTIVILVLIVAMISSVFMCRKQEKPREAFKILLLFVYLPIMDLYPAVYVWYDYNMTPIATAEPNQLVSRCILTFVVIKLILYIMGVILVTVRNRSIYW